MLPLNYMRDSKIYLCICARNAQTGTGILYFCCLFGLKIDNIDAVCNFTRLYRSINEKKTTVKYKKKAFIPFMR